MEEFLLTDVFGSCHKNSSNTGRTDVLGKTFYFVNKCSQMFYWGDEYKYLVEMLNFDQYTIGKHKSCTNFFSACVQRTRNSRIPLER
jgi:hypothetical protein